MNTGEKRRTNGVALTAILLIGFSLGCGGKYDKPLEVDKEPRTGLYNHTGSYRVSESSTHMSVTGGQLFVTYEEDGELRRYYASGGYIGDVKFHGLEEPTVVGKGPTSVAVADNSGSPVVRVYPTAGGDPILTFADADWQRIGGLAIDETGNIYVSDTERDFIRSYDAKGNRRFEIDLADSGFGIGHVLSPRGIYIDGETLLIAEADPEKSQVQRISINQPQIGIPFSSELPLLSSFTDAEGNDIVFMSPIAVATDTEGHIFVLDEELGMIFRFSTDGISEGIVNTAESDGPDILDSPVSIGTYQERVYALDTEADIVHRWDAAE
jgi:hypothetical protein